MFGAHLFMHILLSSSFEKSMHEKMIRKHVLFKPKERDHRKREQHNFYILTFSFFFRWTIICIKATYIALLDHIRKEARIIRKIESMKFVHISFWSTYTQTPVYFPVCLEWRNIKAKRISGNSCTTNKHIDESEKEGEKEKKRGESISEIYGWGCFGLVWILYMTWHHRGIAF